MSLIQSLDPQLIRALTLLLPAIGIGIAFFFKTPTLRQATGVLLGILWNIPYLFLLNIVAVELGLWSYAATEDTFYSIPIDLILGWAFLWGGLLPYTFQKAHFLFPVGLVVLFDVWVMPEFSSLFSLGDNWLFGEFLLIAVCLLPSLLIYNLTAGQKQVGLRAFMQSIIWGGWNIFLIPAAILLFEGKDIFTLLRLEGWQFTLFVNLMAFAILIGYTALFEFAKIGEGTPLPFDPPKHLVTTGPYAYVANPLQISTVLMFISLAIAFQSWLMLSAIVAMAIYSEGFARWHNKAELENHFKGWPTYKKHVRNWFPRWHPYIQTEAKMYFARRCDICQETLSWLEELSPKGITFFAAENHPSRDLERVAYEHGDGRIEEDGVLAIARAFEHINLLFAILGWFMHLPLISQVLQIIVDGSGERGPKVIRNPKLGDTNE